MWNVYTNRLMVACVLMQLLMVLSMLSIASLADPIATGLIRRQWLDCIAASPPIIIMAVFKIYIQRTAGQQFKYYNPTPQEAEEERRMSMGEKRLRHSDVEKRFLHPALQADKLYTVMVHKKQESLAREVLSAYPWFTSSKHNKEGVLIKAVREVSICALSSSKLTLLRRTSSTILRGTARATRLTKPNGTLDPWLLPTCWVVPNLKSARRLEMRDTPNIPSLPTLKACSLPTSTCLWTTLPRIICWLRRRASRGSRPLAWVPTILLPALTRSPARL